MRFIALGASFAIAAVAGAVHAQGAGSVEAFPERPITIVVPYPAGGATDFTARVIAEPMARLLGKQVIVENKPGASGIVGLLNVAQSRPDGHRIVYTNNVVLIASLLNKDIGYDPLRSFAPITKVVTLPLVLIANKDLPIRNVPELVEYAKQRPGALNYASSGTATYGNLLVNLLAQRAGIKLTHLPYKGETGGTLAVRTGEVHVSLTGPSRGLLNFVADGSIRAIAVGSEKPNELFPGVPPVADTFPGYVAAAWFGLLAPAGTPDGILQKLNAAVQTVLTDKDVREKIVSIGGFPNPMTTAAFSQALQTEHAQLADIIKRNDIKAE